MINEDTKANQQPVLGYYNNRLYRKSTEALLTLRRLCKDYILSEDQQCLLDLTLSIRTGNYLQRKVNEEIPMHAQIAKENNIQTPDHVADYIYKVFRELQGLCYALQPP